MLRLASLELIGFKSFAEKLHLAFGDGITAIVGPNGCGKSNLGDAIAWVLGKQSARSLRGARMEDLIFNGTQKRKPSGFAEVTLRLEWTGSKPIWADGIEITDDHLEITRKLYRSGESLYLINQRRRRLKDVHQVLEDAGLGYASYALIEQGRVDSILSSKPLDRRAIIEEAAQILGYKARRRSAELKLEVASQNLLRVNDIIREVERQLRSLKRQAGKARRYRELKEQFRDIQCKKFVLEAEKFHGQLRILAGELIDLKTAEKNLKNELALSEQSERDSVKKRDQLEALLAGLRQRRSQIYLELDRTENSIQHHQEQIKATQRYLDSIAEEQRIISQSLHKVVEELERFQAERAHLDAEESKVESELLDQEKQAERYGVELPGAEAGLDEVRSRLLRVSADTASLSNLEDQFQQRVQAGEASRERLERERSAHSLQLKESQARVQDAIRAVEKKRSELTQLHNRLSQEKEKKKSLEKKADELKEQAAEIQNRLIAYRERLQSFQEIELRHSQYSEGVQRFLNHLTHSEKVQASGTLADFIETGPEYERLVEEFLNEELEYVLVDSLEEAALGISELKTLKSGKCTFLSLRTSNGFKKSNGDNGSSDLRKQEGVYGTVSELIRMKPEVEAAFYRVLPQRAEAIVVSNLNQAFHLAQSYPESTFVTLEGEELVSRGLVSASAGQSQKLGLLALKREKKELEEEISQRQKRLAASLKQQEKAEKRLAAASKRFAQDQEECFQLEKEILGLVHEKEQWESEKQRQDQALRVLQDEMEQLDQERKQQRERILQNEEELRVKRACQAEVQGILSESQSSLQQMQLEFSRVREKLHLARSDRKVMQERRLALERTLERVEEQRGELEDRQATSQKAQKDNQDRLRTMGAMVQESRSDRSRYQQEAHQSETALAKGEEQYGRWKKSYQEIEDQLVHLRDRKSQLQEQRAQLEVEQARLETQLQNLGGQCQEQLHRSLEQLVEGMGPPEVTLEQLLEPYAELTDRLEEFGPINMTALEEYQENEQRYVFLTKQRQDIEQSIADTRQVIQEMNQRSHEKFRDAFESINGYFQEVFQTLFGGGECGMRLLDEEDLLETGIDIYAQPPGKKLQNVMLLSGGEKAMTTLALLVALFRYRPSQFCLLDEVDSVLDDANVGRFSTLVRQMSEQTQFILITHNKQTMEMAQSIYGVTMQEPGVSQTLSVRF